MDDHPSMTGPPQFHRPAGVRVRVIDSNHISVVDREIELVVVDPVAADSAS